MEYCLKDAIKLSDKCCDQRELLLYDISGGGFNADRTYWLVCGYCRKEHLWREGESRIVSCKNKVTNQNLYEIIESSLTWMNALVEVPKYVDYFCKRLGLDKNKVKKILTNRQ